MYLKKAMMMICCLMIFTACTNNQTTDNSNSDDKSIEFTNHENPNTFNQEKANKAKEILKNADEVQSVFAVNDDKHLLVGVELKHFDRFNMHDTEKELQKKLEKEFPKMKVHLSTDKKIHLELKKLAKKNKQDPLSNKKLKKCIQSIKNLSKEKT